MQSLQRDGLQALTDNQIRTHLLEAIWVVNYACRGAADGPWPAGCAGRPGPKEPPSVDGVWFDPLRMKQRMAVDVSDGVNKLDAMVRVGRWDTLK